MPMHPYGRTPTQAPRRSRSSGLCASAWLGRRAAPPVTRRGARSAAAAPRRREHRWGLPLRARRAADREIARARALHAKVVRVEVPWSALEPSGPGKIEPRALAFLDRLVSDAAAERHRRDRDRRQHTLLGLLRAGVTAAQMRAGAIEQGQRLAPARPLGLRRASSPTWRRATARAWRRSRSGTSPTRPTKTTSRGRKNRSTTRPCCAPPTPRSSRPTQTCTVLAGSLVGSNGVFLRALYAAGIKGYYDGLAVHFYNLTLGSLRAIHETQLANGDDTPLWLDEFGWSSCWPHQQDPAGTGVRHPEGPGDQHHQPLPLAGAHARTSRRRCSTSCRTPRAKTSACSPPRARASRPSRALARVLASPFGSPTR